MDNSKIQITYLSKLNNKEDITAILILEKLFSVKVQNLIVDIQSELAWLNINQAEQAMNKSTQETHIVMARHELAYVATLWASKGQCHSILLDPIIDTDPWAVTPPEFNVKDIPENSISWHSTSWVPKQTTHLNKYFRKICKPNRIQAGGGCIIEILQHFLEFFKQSSTLNEFIIVNDSLSIISDQDWKKMCYLDYEFWIDYAQSLAEHGENEYGIKTLTEACDSHRLEIIKYITQHKVGVIDEGQLEELINIARESRMNNFNDGGCEQFVQSCRKALMKGIRK